jgi:DNA-binding MarR family transcriptional regulator
MVVYSIIPMNRRRDALPAIPCTCGTLRRAARAVTQAYDRALRPTGVRPTQMAVLAALAETGEETQRRLGETLILEKTTLSRELRGLLARGWVRVDRGPTDGRERRIRLTPRGRSQVARAIPAWKVIQARLERALGGDWNRLHAILDRVASAASRLTGEAP